MVPRCPRRIAASPGLGPRRSDDGKAVILLEGIVMQLRKTGGLLMRRDKQRETRISPGESTANVIRSLTIRESARCNWHKDRSGMSGHPAPIQRRPYDAMYEW